MQKIFSKGSSTDYGRYRSQLTTKKSPKLALLKRINRKLTFYILRASWVLLPTFLAPGIVCKHQIMSQRSIQDIYQGRDETKLKTASYAKI